MELQEYTFCTYPNYTSSPLYIVCESHYGGGHFFFLLNTYPVPRILGKSKEVEVDRSVDDGVDSDGIKEELGVTRRRTLVSH